MTFSVSNIVTISSDNIKNRFCMVQDLKFSWWWWLKSRSSGLWCHVMLW